MKRSILLVLATALLASAVPAQANDARITFILRLTFAKAEYIANRVTETDSSYAKFGVRLSALARREAHALAQTNASSTAGGVARHQTIQGLRELRISGREWVLAADAKTRSAVARHVIRATVRLNRGLFRLVVAAKTLGA